MLEIYKAKIDIFREKRLRITDKKDEDPKKTAGIKSLKRGSLALTDLKDRVFIKRVKNKTEEGLD